jgi:hypothetical protein
MLFKSLFICPNILKNSHNVVEHEANTNYITGISDRLSILLLREVFVESAREIFSFY